MLRYQNIILLEEKQDWKRKETGVLERGVEIVIFQTAPMYIQSHMLVLQRQLDIPPLGDDGSISPSLETKEHFVMPGPIARSGSDAA